MTPDKVVDARSPASAPSIVDTVTGPRQFRLWLWVTLVLALVPYVLLLVSVSRDSPYLVQDDARHFVVWFRRMLDPTLFPHDIMADHFDTITPWLYRALYWPLGSLGMDPVATHMYVITPLTGLLFALAGYLFIHQV